MAASAKAAVAGEKATSAKPGAAEQAPASAAGTAPEKKPAEGKAAAGKPGAEKPAAKPAEKTVTKPAEGKAAAPAPSETPEKPAAKPAVQPLRYTIQVMASASSVPVSSAQFRAYRGKVKEYKAEGRFPYKYGVGEYDTREAAQRKLAEVRKVFPGAFVVSCKGTQIVK